MLATALARLEAFAFVGLVEQWALSVCVFHAAFAHTSPTPLWPHRLEFSNVRPGASQASGAGGGAAQPSVQPPHALVDAARFGALAGAARVGAANASGGPAAPAAGAVRHDVAALRAWLGAAGPVDGLDAAVYAAGAKRFAQQAAAYAQGRPVAGQAAAGRRGSNNPLSAAAAADDDAAGSAGPSTNTPRGGGGGFAGENFRGDEKSRFADALLPWFALSAVCFGAWAIFG
jgi:hypothetical protein